MKNIMINMEKHPFYIEIELEDFESILDAALQHEDEFILHLMSELHNYAELRCNNIAES